MKQEAVKEFVHDTAVALAEAAFSGLWAFKDSMDRHLEGGSAAYSAMVVDVMVKNLVRRCSLLFPITDKFEESLVEGVRQTCKQVRRAQTEQKLGMRPEQAGAKL